MRPARFSETENIRRRYRQRYRYMSNGWAVKRTPNATKLARRPVYTIIRPHDKLQPIPRTFYATYKIIFWRCHGRVRVCLDCEWTTERTGGNRTDASFEKHADEMQMLTWQNATRKQMTWKQRRITGRHLAHRIRGVTV